MFKVLYPIFFAALLIPLVAGAQNPEVDYDWTFQLAGAKYGVTQTSWAGYDRTLYLDLGKPPYAYQVHVPVPLPLIAGLVLAPVVLFPVWLVRCARRKNISDAQDVA